LAEITFNDNQVGGDTLVSLQGTESTYHGIARGYASGDLTFQTDTWNGAPDPGEFSVSGTGFNALSEHHQYTWDHHNRLTSVEIGYVSESKHSQQYDYFYDAVGRLMGKEFLPASGKLAFQTFVWEGDREILRIQTENDRSPEFLVSRYFHGDAVDMVLAEEKYVYQGWTDPPIVGGGSRAYSIPGETLWYLADHLGSVRGVVDNDGVTRQHLSYDSFGNRVFDQNYSSTGTTISSTDKLAVDVIFGYTGRFWDADIGLQSNRARWYAPSQGRWISQDPIGFAAGDANLYRYVGNGPTTKTDPSGLQSPGEQPWYSDSGWDYLNPWAYNFPIGQRSIADGVFGTVYSWGPTSRAIELDREIANRRKLDGIHNPQCLDFEQFRKADGLSQAQADRIRFYAQSGIQLNAMILGGGAIRPTGVGLVDDLPLKLPADVPGGGLQTFTYTLNGGKLRRPLSGGQLGSFKGQRLDFIISSDGKFLLGRGHSVLSDGCSVKFAGQLKFNQKGNIVEITNNSGHFKPPSGQGLTHKAKDYLEQLGIEVSGAQVTEVGG